MRNNNGKIEVAPRTAVVAVAIALSLGAGGTSIAAFFSPSTVADHETRLTVVERVQEERDREISRRLRDLERAVKDLTEELRRQ